MEYLDKKGLAHLVEKNNETYALKRENNNLKGQVLSLKAKLKKRDKKIVVRKAINPNSVNEGNVWYYHHNPTLLIGNGYSRHKIFINGKEVTKSSLKVKRGTSSENGGLYVQYSNEQKRFWIYYKNDSGKNTMWLENRGIAVDIGLTYNEANDQGYLSRVTAVDYDKSLHMKIVYIEMELVNNFTSTTSNPYLRIENGQVVSNGKVPFVKTIPSINLDKSMYSCPKLNRETRGKEYRLYLWRVNKTGNIDKPGASGKYTLKYTHCTKAKYKFNRGKYMLKIFKRGIYCGNIKFRFFKIYGKNGIPKIYRKML